MPEPLAAPVKLTPAHDTGEFDCGVPDLTDWLRRWAYGNQQAGNASTYVAARGQRVVGYYALAACSVAKASAPERVVKGGVPAQVPCLLLARLAVDVGEQGSGLGRGLLVDALRRSVRVAGEVGIRALLIHARDDDARDFYLHHGEFVASPTDPLHLFLLLKHARQLLADEAQSMLASTTIITRDPGPVPATQARYPSTEVSASARLSVPAAANS